MSDGVSNAEHKELAHKLMVHFEYVKFGSAIGLRGFMSTSPQTSGPQTSGLQTLQPIVIVHTAIITPRKIKQQFDFQYSEIKKFEELLSFNLTGVLAKDIKPKSTEKSESKAAENLEMEPKQEKQPTKSTAEGAAIPMPWTSNTNMDDNNNTNTSPTPSTTNEDKRNEGDGVKAPKLGIESNKKKLAPLAEEVFSSPPPKKAAIESNKGMKQFDTPHPMFCPPPFGYPFPPCSSGHLPMPIYQQQNEVQTIIIKDNKQENSADAKDGNGLYRNCLVCGDNNKKCGKHTGTGLQVCDGCRQFFKRVAGSSSDRKATFQCSEASGSCLISKETRNSCEFCRFQACLKAGMDPHELKAKRKKQKTSGNDN